MNYWQMRYQAKPGNGVPAQSGVLSVFMDGCVIVFTVMHTTCRPPTDALLYQALASLIQTDRLGDVVFYQVMTRRSHADVPDGRRRVVRLYLRRRRGQLEAYGQQPFQKRSPFIDYVMRRVYMTDIAVVFAQVAAKASGAPHPPSPTKGTP